jgi:hypothetical protein
MIHYLRELALFLAYQLAGQVAAGGALASGNVVYA